MNRRRPIRTAIANYVFRSLPPSIRASLLDDAEFREEYGIKPEAIITFGDSGVSVRRSTLYDAIRKTLSGQPTPGVVDSNNGRWKLNNTAEVGDVAQLELVRGEQRQILPDYSVLSDDPDKRLSSYNEAAHRVNLPSDVSETWRNKLSRRILHDDEVDELMDEFRQQPAYRRQIIRDEFLGGQGFVETLVPHSRMYYERLVGTYDESPSIRDYAVGSGNAHFAQLLEWDLYNGFLLSLYLASHASLTSEIEVQNMSEDDLVRAYSFLAQYGDRISQLGAIEVGFRILDERPSIGASLIRIIEQIRDDDIEGKSSGFKLLSALFQLVDGELSRTRLFAETPPFYRRLAALSQAALIQRELSGAVENDSFYEWAFKSRGMNHYLQSLADLRLAPGWNPEYSTAFQLKQEFIGRIILAANVYTQNLKDPELRALMMGNAAGSLVSLAEAVLPFLPGPLEGNDDIVRELPEELKNAIEEQLNAGEVGPDSFAALVNSALIYRVEPEQADFAAHVLEVGNHRLVKVKSSEQLHTVLNGLAIVAAVSRSSMLADAVRILMRRYGRDAQYGLTIVEKARVCLIASGCHADLNDWRIFAGEWLTELAFGNLEENEGEVLLSYVDYLCHIVPELWVSCSKADAALRAYNASRHPP